jgi:hypothetical protein
MEANRTARRFYERLGWSPDGRKDSSSYPPHPNLLGYSIALSN